MKRPIQLKSLGFLLFGAMLVPVPHVHQANASIAFHVRSSIRTPVGAQPAGWTGRMMAMADSGMMGKWLGQTKIPELALPSNRDTAMTSRELAQVYFLSRSYARAAEITEAVEAGADMADFIAAADTGIRVTAARQAEEFLDDGTPFDPAAAADIIHVSRHLARVFAHEGEDYNVVNHRPRNAPTTMRTPYIKISELKRQQFALVQRAAQRAEEMFSLQGDANLEAIGSLAERIAGELVDPADALSGDYFGVAAFSVEGRVNYEGTRGPSWGVLTRSLWYWATHRGESHPEIQAIREQGFSEVPKLRVVVPRMLALPSRK